jgi:hypothetical protein
MVRDLNDRILYYPQPSEHFREHVNQLVGIDWVLEFNNFVTGIDCNVSVKNILKQFLYLEHQLFEGLVRIHNSLLTEKYFRGVHNSSPLREDHAMRKHEAEWIASRGVESFSDVITLSVSNRTRLWNSYQNRAISNFDKELLRETRGCVYVFVNALVNAAIYAANALTLRLQQVSPNTNLVNEYRSSKIKQPSIIKQADKIGHLAIERSTQDKLNNDYILSRAYKTLHGYYTNNKTLAPELAQIIRMISVIDNPNIDYFVEAFHKHTCHLGKRREPGKSVFTDIYEYVEYESIFRNVLYYLDKCFLTIHDNSSENNDISIKVDMTKIGMSNGLYYKNSILKDATCVKIIFAVHKKRFGVGYELHFINMYPDVI